MIEHFQGRIPANTRVAYYTGNLATDCYHNAELRTLRAAAWDASEAGEVELSQERISDGVCRYWAKGLSEGIRKAILREKAEKLPVRRARAA
jgi:hypothetical protein